MGKALRALHSRARPLLALTCAAAVLATLVVAFRQPGFAEVPPAPDDRSVWVVNESSLLVGRINTGIAELDSAAVLRGAGDVLQDPTDQGAGKVAVIDTFRHELQLLDTAAVAFGARVSIPDDADVEVRGRTVAVTDRTDGRLWVGSSGAVESVDARLIPPAATLGAAPALAVSTVGTAFATAVGSNTLVSLTPGQRPVSTDMPGGPLTPPGGGADGADGTDRAAAVAGGAVAGGAVAGVQITAVGETPVVLDSADSSLRALGRRFALPDATGAVLQQPGPAADSVLIATTAALLSVGLDDGTVRTLAEGSGSPVAPAVNGGCTYGAWIGGAPASSGGTGAGADQSGSTSGTGSANSAGSTAWAFAACGGEPATPVALVGTGSDPTDLESGPVSYQFRQRGSALVLNDSASGRSWVPGGAGSGFRLVYNWADVAPPDPTTDDSATKDDLQSTADLPRLPPDCTGVPIGEPRAADDTFGVRTGRATVLRVLDNDPSVDCTSVVIDSVSALPAAAAEVAIVAGGTAIQVTPAPGVGGDLPPIEYQVDNGRGGTATAYVQLSVVPADESDPPRRVRRSAASVEVNSTVSYNVLDDYVSPTGDDLYLVSASTEGGDAVSFRPDGTITFRNVGSGAGTDRRVEFVVTDGTEQASGTLTVAIASEHSTSPVVYPVVTRAIVGATATATPLRSISSGAPDPVIIGSVEPQPGSEAASARVDAARSTVQVTSTGAGTYYFTFEASTGDRNVTGVLRADFVEPTEQSSAVVPMADVAYLPAGGSVVIDPLANDTDPDGEGLAVREIDLTGQAPLSAAVMDLHLVQVSAARPPKGTVMFGYSVFDGENAGGSGAGAEKVGQIRVVPVPAPKKAPPPLASPITATVRAGDALTVEVARYASTQDGSPVTAELDEAQVAGLPGRAFSTGDTIRYLAPVDQPPGRLTFSYTATSANGSPLEPVQPVGTVSTVSITVTDPDPARNSAPEPPPDVTARVFAGGSIAVAVPLAGIDPDGDWVVLASLDQPDAPLGQVSIAGPDTLSYQAFGVPGVDRIRYVATDTAGATVTGVVTVLVVDPGESARPPVAPDLSVSVRPGASVRIDPLAAVVDPGGQHIQLADPAFTATPGLVVALDGQSLIVTAPEVATVAGLRYTVINAKGLSASGSVTITVSKDAPLLPPVVKDVFVRPADLADSTGENATVDVDVSGSIVNRSGRTADLTVTVDPLSARQATMAGSHTVRVTVGSSRQVVAYQVRDLYGASATALIVVPPRAQVLAPQLIADAGPIEVDAGDSVEVAIADYVTVGGSGDPVIARSPAPRATQGSAVRNSASSLTLTVPASAAGSAALYVPIESPIDSPIPGGAGDVAVLALPVQIAPRVIPPPELDSSELQVEAGSSGSVDLASLTRTFDEGQAASLTYSAGQPASGLQVSQQGSVLTVTVPPEVPRGTSVTVPIEVVDGDGKSGKAALAVTVTGSRLPLATVPDQSVEDGRGGVPVAVDMLTGSVDPIGRGLTVSKATALEGAAGALAGPTLDGSTVRLTPAPGFVGDIVVAVDVTDGTRDPERTVTATLRVGIQDRPSAPGAPAVIDGTTTATSVQLVWAPAEANGSVITGYTVESDGITQICPGLATSCVVTGLTPGLAYVFVVTASNAVGDSDPSPPSAAVVPDSAPGRPAAPSVAYLGRGRLSVSWTDPTGDFTPVTATALQILRDDQVVQTREDVRSPLTLDGLDPGSAYRFQVRAGNRAGVGPWSDPSAPVLPSGVPSAPTGLTAAFGYDGTLRQVDVRWQPPQDAGGEPVQGYRVLVNNAEVLSGGADVTSASVPVAGDEPMSFSVVARNSRGEGPATDAVTVAPFSRPPAVQNLTVTPADSALELSWSVVVPGIDHYEYRLDGGGWTSTGASASGRVDGLTNGTTYQVQVRACNGQTAFTEQVRCGPAGDPVPGRPFGPLADPTVTAALTTRWGSSVTVEFSFPDSNGRAVTSTRVEVSGVGQVDVAPGSWTGDIGFGKSVAITASWCVADPQECSTTTVQSPTTATPVPLPTVGPAPLTGTCGVVAPNPGTWRTQPECPHDWVAAPDPVRVLCTDSGPSYPEDPSGSDSPGGPVAQVDTWYLAVNGLWYRTPGLADPGDGQVPRC